MNCSRPSLTSAARTRANCRAASARSRSGALMTQPSLLMLDEPTAGVSPIVMDEAVRPHHRGGAHRDLDPDGRTERVRRLRSPISAVMSSCRARMLTPTPARRCLPILRSAAPSGAEMDILNAIVTLLNFVVIPALPPMGATGTWRAGGDADLWHPAFSTLPMATPWPLARRWSFW